MQQSKNYLDEMKLLFSSIAKINKKGSVIHKFKRKEVIFQQGDIADSFLFLISGKVNVVRHYSDTEKFIVASFGKESVLGEMGLFVGDKMRTTSIEVAEDVEVFVITYENFMNYIQSDYRPLFFLTTIMAERLHTTTRHAETVATMNMKDRLVKLLIDLFNSPLGMRNDDGSVSVKMSRKEMASRIGCSRELAGKHLKELMEEGVVDNAGMNICIKPVVESYFSK